MKRQFLSVFLLFLLLPVRAEVRLAAVFTDHMVIQRNMPVRVWGWADPREKVTVLFNGQQKNTRAGRDGSWQVELDPMAAETRPLTLAVRGRNSLQLDDILIGDVWICSGQSNMQWTLRQLEAGPEEARNADIRLLRMFTVTREMALTPQKELSGTGWQAARGEQVTDFSAVAYYFGKHLTGETGIPIGLLTTSWGGTNVEAWTSRERLQQFPHFREIYAGVDSLIQLEEEAPRISPEQRLDMIKEWVYRGKGLQDKWQESDPGPGQWKPVILPQENDNPVFRDYDGAVWFRREFDLPGPFRGKDLRFNLGRISDHDMVWVNGELIGESFGPGRWRNYDAPAGILREKENEIVVRVFDYGEEGGFITDPYNLNFHPVGDNRGYQLLAGDWVYRESFRMEKPLDLPPDRTVRDLVNRTPSSLFNQMIHPLLRLSITGAIWYQGESNASRAREYATLFPEMIRDWRDHWDQGDFPFLFVQLAAYDRPATQTWPELREAQRRALELPETGMAVTIDIGHPTNIHPENKWDVGKRLALPALKMVYGKDLTWSGPILRSADPVDGKMKLIFRQVGEGMVVKDNYGYLMGFELSANGMDFEYARGEIRNGNTVWLWSDKVPEPRYVRYGWENYPDEANLFNSEGLPASPFRTGKWNWITEGNLYGN